MTTLTITENQLRVIQNALDFYARVGIGQMNVITDHPTFENSLYEKLKPKKELEIGDKTNRGEILEINKNYIKTKGNWNGKEEIKTWKDIDNIKLSIDYSIFHQIKDESQKLLNKGRNLLLEKDLLSNGSYGINNPNVDESCRIAHDILQVIRYEFWKNNQNQNNNVVASSVYLTTKDSDKIKCKIDELF
jgi:hypothetical protein